MIVPGSLLFFSRYFFSSLLMLWEFSWVHFLLLLLFSSLLACGLSSWRGVSGVVWLCVKEKVCTLFWGMYRYRIQFLYFWVFSIPFRWCNYLFSHLFFFFS
ncbi:hypothetical protein BJ508DRAFT_153972 [Ascobolus immersus RN42]|uniref:Uncharacterized protein n=1 Tax=Ascobolus immersus RN42 TaxID=1160509 RepID=A0A3N4I3P5_ASCIM|nr:hypothetical protein BJ508DRAFT_153972 [Ascobolus immersus RN42]